MAKPTYVTLIGKVEIEHSVPIPRTITPLRTPTPDRFGFYDAMSIMEVGDSFSFYPKQRATVRKLMQWFHQSDKRFHHRREGEYYRCWRVI